MQSGVPTCTERLVSIGAACDVCGTTSLWISPVCATVGPSASCGEKQIYNRLFHFSSLNLKTMPLTFVLNSAVAPFPVLALLPTTQLSTDARRHPCLAACIWDFGGLQWRMFAPP